MANTRDISQFKKLDIGDFYNQYSKDKSYELLIVRGNEYPTLEEAHNDGAVYEVENTLNWQEADGAILGIQATAKCIDANVIIDIYARITD